MKHLALCCIVNMSYSPKKIYFILSNFFNTRHIIIIEIVIFVPKFFSSSNIDGAKGLKFSFFILMLIKSLISLFLDQLKSTYFLKHVVQIPFFLETIQLFSDQLAFQLHQLINRLDSKFNKINFIIKLF